MPKRRRTGLDLELHLQETREWKQRNQIRPRPTNLTEQGVPIHDLTGTLPTHYWQPTGYKPGTPKPPFSKTISF